MDTLLIKSSIKGIKNLSNKIDINYIKSNFDMDVFNDNHVKAIYGANGVGKSAIVHAYDTYKFVTLNKYPFLDILFVTKFAELLNNKTKEFEIENIVANTNVDGILRVSHKIVIGLNSFNEFYFKKEIIRQLNSRLEYGKTFFEQENGEVKVALDENHLSTISKTDFKSNSIVTIMVNAIYDRHKSDNKTEFSPFENVVSACFLLATRLQITYGSLEDNHEYFNTFTLMRSIKEKKDVASLIKDYSILRSLVTRMKGERYLWIFNKKEEDNYRQLVVKLTYFLKLLKPSLKSIEPKIDYADSIALCNLVFHYQNGSVDYEFESTGIKKLCALFIGLYNASKGSISFIDEIDSGVHDVFLSRLIEYFTLYNDCQLIITTHHVGLMEVVKQISKSIDFITEKGTIKQWVKNGDLSPSSLYLKGNIEGLPFNLNAIEFSEVFGETDD